MISFKQFITEQARLSFDGSRDYTYDFFKTYFETHGYNNEIIDIDNTNGIVDFRRKELTNLQWKFGKISWSFTCAGNDFRSLENSPTYVGGDFRCESTFITSLEHCPEYVGEEFWCFKTPIKSLVGIHKHLKHCQLFSCEFCPIEEGGLGLLLINGLEKIETDHPAIQIISKYVGQGKKGMMLAHVELIENGYEQFAKL